MEPYFERVTIIGVGLLGASLGLALKARGLAGHVTGVGRRQSSLDAAMRHGAIDTGSLDLCAAARAADLIVFAAPAAQIPEHMEAARACCPGTALLTDVASTKALICERAAALWPNPRRFVGSHPMAGSEKFGPEHGRADFYENSVCLIEENAGLDSSASAAIARLWEAVGAQVIPIDPALHDALLARTSHIPHVVAAAVAALAVQRGDVRKLIGNGFKDVTRIAGSRPEVWRDICGTNREAMLDGLAELQACLADFSAALQENDLDAVERFFEAGRAARRKAVEE